MDTVIKRQETSSSETFEDSSDKWEWYHLLPAVALGIFIFTPTLTWKFGLPGAVHWIGDLAVMAMIVLVVIRMLTIDRIPGAFLVILALSVIGIIMASFEGQEVMATIWGLWTTFRYPLAGLYVFLIPQWPKKVAGWIPKIGLSLLAFQVLVQIALFLTGVKAGDFLSGTFGRKGTGLLILFIMQMVAIAFGQWLSDGSWKLLLATLVLGGVSSVFGEMKLFIIATPLMAAVTFAIQLLRRGHIRKMLLFVGFLMIAVVGYINFYNVVVSQGNDTPSLEAFLEGDKLDRYINSIRGNDDLGPSHIGRGIAGQFAWKAIQRDFPTLLFGYGIGTSQISAALGITGAGFNSGYYGVLIGSTSLMVMMQEMGLVGMFVLTMFMFMTIIILYRATRRYPDANLDVLRFGTLLYTLFWPLWIWYNSAWTMSGPALIYWIIWGYIMQLSMKPTTMNLSGVTQAVGKSS